MSAGVDRCPPGAANSLLAENHGPVSGRLKRCQGSPHAFIHSPLFTEHLSCCKVIAGTEDSVMRKKAGSLQWSKLLPRQVTQEGQGTMARTRSGTQFPTPGPGRREDAEAGT